MARKPLYGLHKATNQARTTLNGRRVYLGVYDSPESRRAYDEILAEWENARAERDTVVQTKLTVDRLAVLFLKHAQETYQRDGEPTGEAKNFRYALKDLLKTFTGCRLMDLGPKKLKHLQSVLVKRGLAQSTVNGRIRRVVSVVEWAVSEELTPPRILEGLKTVKGLRKGRTKAKAPKAKGAVAIKTVKATLPT